MALKPKAKLDDRARTFVVQSLACFDAPSVVTAAVRKDFGFEIAPQSIEAYDPNKRAGWNLAPKWKALFEETRKRFLDETANIGVANKAVRLRMIGRIAERAEGNGNVVVALQALEQAAKEVGNAFTNTRVLTGKDGSALIPVPIAASMTPQEAAAAYADTLHGDE